MSHTYTPHGSKYFRHVHICFLTIDQVAGASTRLVLQHVLWNNRSHPKNLAFRACAQLIDTKDCLLHATTTLDRLHIPNSGVFYTHHCSQTPPSAPTYRLLKAPCTVQIDSAHTYTHNAPCHVLRSRRAWAVVRFRVSELAPCCSSMRPAAPARA